MPPNSPPRKPAAAPDGRSYRADTLSRIWNRSSSTKTITTIPSPSSSVRPSIARIDSAPTATPTGSRASTAAWRRIAAPGALASSISSRFDARVGSTLMPTASLGGTTLAISAMVTSGRPKPIVPLTMPPTRKAAARVASCRSE